VLNSKALKKIAMQQFFSFTTFNIALPSCGKESGVEFVTADCADTSIFGDLFQ
jgi:hypothetical protein